jgi:hypothetical protein
MIEHAHDRAERALLAQAETVIRLQQRIQIGVDPSVTIERLLGPRPRAPTSARTCGTKLRRELANTGPKRDGNRRTTPAASRTSSVHARPIERHVIVTNGLNRSTSWRTGSIAEGRSIFCERVARGRSPCDGSPQLDVTAGLYGRTVGLKAGVIE